MPPAIRIFTPSGGWQDIALVGPQGPAGPVGYQVFMWFSDGENPNSVDIPGTQTPTIIPLYVPSAANKISKSDGISPDFSINPNNTIQILKDGFYEITATIEVFGAHATAQNLVTQVGLANPTGTDTSGWGLLDQAVLNPTQTSPGNSRPTTNHAVGVWLTAGQHIGLEGYVNTVTATTRCRFFSIARTGTGPKGDAGPIGPTGAAGPQGIPGVGAGGVGMPIGGALGDAIVKKSATDYDVQWAKAGFSAPTYSAVATYKQGDYVKYNGSLWQAKGDIAAGTGYPGEPNPVLIASGVSTPPTRYLSASQLGTWIDVTVDSGDPITSLRTGPMEIFGIRFATPGTMSFTSRPTGADWDAFALLMKEAGASDATIAATADDEAGHGQPAFTAPIAVTAGNYFLTFSGYDNSVVLPQSSQLQITLGGGATLGAMPSGPGWNQIVAGVPAGGVGGQVLGKKSAVDFDFAWSGGLVTSLPANPYDGQECYFLASATDGVIWHLRYRAASSFAYKWEFLGGSDLQIEGSSGGVNPGAAAWSVIQTTMQFTAPLNGEWDIEYGGTIQAGAATLVDIGLAIGGAAATQRSSFSHSGASTYSTPIGRQKSVVTNGQNAIVQWRSSLSAFLTKTVPWMRVRPVRVS